jgi:hypothetical protein
MAYVIVIEDADGEIEGIVGPFDGAPDHDQKAMEAWDALKVAGVRFMRRCVWVVHEDVETFLKRFL